MKKLGVLFLVTACLYSCQTGTVGRTPSSSELNGSEMKMGDPAVAPACTSFSTTVSDQQAAVIAALISTRSHRLQHALWHATRAGLTTKEESSVVTAFGQSWGKVESPAPTQFHPMCPGPGKDSTAADYNPAGEDFLFMHRQMVYMVRTALIASSLPCISGWTNVPTLDQWALPDSDVTGPKSPAALAQLTAWDQTFHDPKWLSSISLSQLGWALEFTIHNNLHMRYATTQPPAGFEGVDKTGGAPIPFNGKFPANWQYDQAAYNWLADPYGAAVNSTFWKIHGYVDQMIDLWLKNNNYDRVAVSCDGAKDRCYQWKGTWTGEMDPNLSMKNGLDALESPAGHSNGKIDPATLSFNQKRMRNQMIGVLTANPNEGTGLMATAPPQDPIEFTQSKLCAPSK